MPAAQSATKNAKSSAASLPQLEPKQKIALLRQMVAVRRFEHEQYAHLNREHLADKFRMAWSV